MLEFRILGPLEVLEADRPVELGGARQRAVLAILLLHRGETVSVDRIVDLMWGERPPTTAVKTVQVYVSHLRKALVEDVVVSSRGGYALAVDAQRVDAVRFERLVDDGRAALAADDPAPAAQLLRSALELWRGPVLGDLAYEDFAQDEVARLEELRLTALEERIDADLRLGRHVELVAELEGLVREYPLRERLRAQHMLALYRSGRQADALESLRDARRSLVDELGLEPGRELRELEQAILAHDPALDLPRNRVRPPPQARRRRGLALIAAGAVLAGAAAAVALVMNASGADVAVLPDSVAVIDPESDLIAADVPVGVRPEKIVADGSSIWVANATDGTVSQIDARKHRVVATIAPGIDVDALAADAGSAWVADTGRGRAVRLDADIGTVADSVRFPTRAELEFSPAPRVGTGSLWVPDVPLAAVFRLETGRKLASTRVDVGNQPAGIAVGDGALWVSDSIENNVRRIVPAGAGVVTDTIPVGSGAGPIAAGEGAIWVANSRDDTVSRIDPATRAVVARIPVGRLPSGVAVGAGSVWVANSLARTVSRIDPRTNRVAKTIGVGGAPHSVVVADGRVWVSIQEPTASPAPAGGPSVARVLLDEYPDIRDPAGTSDTPRLYATCARLMTYASGSGSGAAELVPELATAPPAVSSGGRVYTFELRGGYRFSPPSGAPVTAAAFQRAIERTLRNPLFDESLADDIVGAEAYRRRQAPRVAGVSARGDRLTITLERASPTLPARLATFYFCAVPPNTPIRPRGFESVATAGPYYVAEAERGRRLLLRRNPGYPGPRPQRLEEIELTTGAAPRRAVADVEAGRADYLPHVPRGAQARLIERYGPGSRAAAAGRQQYFAGPNLIIQGLLFNPNRPLFARASMRRAVNFAIDRRALTQHPIPEMLAGRPTDQLMPPGWPGYRDATIYPLGGPNLAKARRLAGGGERRGVLYTCNLPICLEHAEIVRANLAAIGIDLEIREFSYTAAYTRIERPGEPWDIAAMFGWIGEFPDPAQFVDQMFRWFSAFSFLDRGEFGPRMRAASRLEGAARIDAYAALDRDIAAREAPIAPVTSAVHTDFFSARIGCQVEHPLYGIDLAALCVRD
jgi:YVTN family beta-propeller protein